jgi:hypothetical protein
LKNSRLTHEFNHEPAGILLAYGAQDPQAYLEKRHEKAPVRHRIR